MKEITFEQAIKNLNEYINNEDFDNEYLEHIYSYLLNTDIKISN